MTTIQINNRLEVQQLTTGRLLQREEISHALSTSDRQIIEAASVSSMLMNIEEADYLEAIRPTLARIGFLAGIKTPPTEAEFQLLANFLRKHFRTTTVAEIEIAIELNMIGQLGERIEHFHKLNADFVSAVLTNFKYKRKIEAFKSMKVAQNSLKEETTLKMTDQQAFETLSKIFEETGAPPIAFCWSKAYNYYISIGLEVRTIEERNKFKEEIQKKIDQRRTLEMLAAQTKLQRLDVERSFTVDTLKTECQKVSLINYFKNK